MSQIQFKLSVGGKTYNGPSLRSILEDHAKTFAHFSQREVNSIYRYAGVQAAELWVTVFLPMRWDASYAKMLGYHAESTYNQWKIDNQGKTVQFQGRNSTLAGKETFVATPQPTPMYLSGASKRTAFQSVRPYVVATSGKLEIHIKIDAGSIKFHNRDVFYRVPPNEYRRVVREVETIVKNQLAPMAKTQTMPRYITDFKNPRPLPRGAERPIAGVENRRGYAG